MFVNQAIDFQKVTPPPPPGGDGGRRGQSTSIFNFIRQVCTLSPCFPVISLRIVPDCRSVYNLSFPSLLTSAEGFVSFFFPFLRRWFL